LWLRATARIGQAEVQLEHVVAIRILVPKVVEVRVVPREPATRSGEERGVEDLPVVGGRVLVGGEVRADSELLEHDRPAQASGKLAGERGREELADGIVLHGVRVGAEEIDERRKGSQRIAVVL